MKRINWKMIRDFYQNHPDINLKDLSKRYHVSYGTLCNHSSKYDWKNEDSREMIEILDKNGLNGKQRLFCELYLKSYNAYEAYHNAFNCKWSTARTNAYRLLRNHKIQTTLRKLHRKQAVNLHIDRSDVLEQMIRDYFGSDPGKFVKFGNHVVTSKNGRKYHRSYAYLKNKHGDTRVLQGININRDGTPSVSFPDRERLGEFLYQILPARMNQTPETDTLVKAFETSLPGINHQKRLEHEVKSLKSKLKAKDRDDK